MGRLGVLALIAIAVLAGWIALREPQFFARLAGREPEALALCEHGIKQAVRSPTTYKRFESTIGPVADNREEIFIYFDAANAYGTPIRGLAKCRLGIWRHKPEPELLTIEIDGEAVDPVIVSMAGITWITERSKAGY